MHRNSSNITKTLTQDTSSHPINSNLHAYRVASTGKLPTPTSSKGVHTNDQFIKQNQQIKPNSNKNGDLGNEQTNKKFNNKAINTFGEFGKNLYGKMQNQFTDFIKDKKSQVRFQGNKRYSGKTGEYFLKAKNNENQVNSEIFYFDNNSEDSNMQSNGSNNKSNLDLLIKTNRKDVQTNKPNMINGQIDHIPHKNFIGQNLEVMHIIEKEKITQKNIELIKNEKTSDRISTLMKDIAIIKEHQLNEKVITKTKETIITLDPDLTPLPDIDRRKLNEDSFTKKRFDKAERAAVLMRRMEYAMGKNKKIKKISVQTEDNLQFIFKIIKLQRWWRGLKKTQKYDIKSIIKIQKNIKGFIFRKNFYEDLKNLNKMFCYFVQMEKKINFTYIKKYFKLFKRYYYMKKILIKVMFIQKHWRKVLRYHKAKRLGLLLQKHLKAFAFIFGFGKLRANYNDIMKRFNFKKLILKLNKKKLKNLTRKSFLHYANKVKKLLTFERVFLTAFPLMRLHIIKYKNFIKNFIQFLKNKRRREILLNHLVINCDDGRYMKLNAHTKQWNQISQRQKIMLETNLSNKSKAIHLLNLLTIKKQRRCIYKRFTHWRYFIKALIKNKLHREIIINGLIQLKDKTRAILIRTYTLRLLNLAMNRKYKLEKEELEKDKALIMLNELTLKNMQYIIKGRFYFWRDFNSNFSLKKNRKEFLLKTLFNKKVNSRCMLLTTISFIWLNLAFKHKQKYDTINSNKVSSVSLIEKFTMNKQIEFIKKKFIYWKKSTNTYIQNKIQRDLILNALVVKKDRNRQIIFRTLKVKWINLALKIQKICEIEKINRAKSLEMLKLLSLHKLNTSIKRVFYFWKEHNNSFKANKSQREKILKLEIINKEKAENIIYSTIILKWLTKALKLKKIINDKEVNKIRGAKQINFITTKLNKNFLQHCYQNWRDNNQKSKNKLSNLRKFLLKHFKTYDLRSKLGLIQQKFNWWKTLYLLDKRLMKFLNFSTTVKKIVIAVSIKFNAAEFLNKLSTLKINKEKEMFLKILKKNVQKISESNLLNLQKERFNKWRKFINFQKETKIKARLLLLLKNKLVKKEQIKFLNYKLNFWKNQKDKLKYVRFTEGFRKLYYFVFFGVRNLNYYLLNDREKDNQNSFDRISEIFKENLKKENKFSICSRMKASGYEENLNQINLNGFGLSSEKIEFNFNENQPIKNNNKEIKNDINKNFILLNPCSYIKFFVFCLEKNIGNQVYMKDYSQKRPMAFNLNFAENQKAYYDIIFLPYTKNSLFGINTLLYFIQTIDNNDYQIENNNNSNILIDSPNKFSSPNKYYISRKQNGEYPINLNFIFFTYIRILDFLSIKQKQFYLTKYISFISQDYETIKNKYFHTWRNQTELLRIKQKDFNTYSLIVFKIFKGICKNILKRSFDDWRSIKNQIKKKNLEDNKYFLESLKKFFLLFCTKKYLIIYVKARSINMSFKKILENLNFSYQRKLKDAFNLWRLYLLKLEKIRLLKNFSAFSISKHVSYLEKKLIKKYFNMLRIKAVKLKKLEFHLVNLIKNQKKQYLEFLIFQINLKSKAIRRLIKIFSYLSDYRKEELCKKYFIRWMKFTYKNKINLDLINNLRKRLQKLQKIRNSPLFLLDKYFNLWIDKYNLRWKFEKFLKLRNFAASKITNIIRMAKYKFKIIKNKKLKRFLQRRIHLIERFKKFSTLSYLYKWKRAAKKFSLTQNALKIVSFMESVIFALKNIAFQKIDALFTKMLIKVANREFRFLKIIMTFCKEYDFFNKQKQIQTIKYLKPSQTNALFTHFNKTFEIQKNSLKTLNNLNLINESNNNKTNHKSFLQTNLSSSNLNNENNQFSNIFLFYGRPVNKTDYFKYKCSLLNRRFKRNNFIQNSIKERNIFKIASSNNISFKNSLITSDKSINCNFYNTQNEEDYKTKIYTKEDSYINHKTFISNCKNHILVKRLNHVIQFFILRKDLIVNDMKKKHYFKRWEFSKKDWLSKIKCLQKNIIKFLRLQKVLKLKENRALFNYVVRKYFYRKLNNKKFAMHHYFRKFINWTQMQKLDRFASTLQIFIKSLYSQTLIMKNMINKKFFEMFKKYILKKNYSIPLKLIKFVLLLKSANKKFANNLFKYFVLNITRGKLIIKKYTEILIKSNETNIRTKRNSLFISWRNYSKAIKMLIKKSFEVLKKNINNITKTKLLEERYKLMKKLMHTKDIKMNRLLKILLYKWKSENNNYKALLFMSNMRHLAFYKFKNAYIGLRILLRYVLLKKKILKSHFSMKLKFFREAGYRKRLMKMITSRIEQIIIERDSKEKRLKKSFMLLWNRQAQNIDCILKIFFIQKRFLTYLRKKKYLKLLNFVKCYNEIVNKKILNTKKSSFKAFVKYANIIKLIARLNDIYSEYNFEMKKEFYKTLLNLTEIKKAKEKCRVLFCKRFIREIFDGAKHYKHFEKLMNLIETTFKQKERAKYDFLRVLMRNWRFIALSESMMRKKIQVFQDHMKALEEELVERMLNKDHITVPKDELQKGIIQNPNVVNSKKIADEKFNQIKQTKKNLNTGISKLIKQFSKHNLDKHGNKKTDAE